MPDVVVVGLAGLLTALVTGLGAVPVFALGARAVALRPLLWGGAAGLMSVAAVVGLLAPALDEASVPTVAGGAAAGVVFLVVVHVVTGHRPMGEDAAARDRRTALIVFVVLLVHSFPEGLAIGTAAASDRAGLDVFVIAAMPWSFAFAAGAMLAVVVADLVPRAFTRDGWRLATLGAAAGSAVMLVLAALVGV